MTADQLQGHWLPFKRELKRRWGEFTDEDLGAIEGNLGTFMGMVQERYGDRHDEVMQWADDWHAKVVPAAAASIPL